MSVANFRIRMGRADVPVRVRRSVVQVHIERTDIASTVVTSAALKGSPFITLCSFICLLNHRGEVSPLRGGHGRHYPSRESGLQERAAPRTQYA